MTNTIVDILLVEDREEDAELALMALQENNLVNSVKWVKDGQEAIDFLFKENNFEESFGDRPKIVLLDIKMPKVDGIEVLRKIRSESCTRTMPVIMLTTSNQERDRINAYNLGVNSFIVKPVEFESFMKAVQDIGLYWLLLNEPPVE